MQAAADVSSPPSATTVWSRSRSAFGLEGGSSGGESPDSGATAAATAAAAAADIGGGSSSAITPVSAIGNDDTIICQRQNHHHHHNRTGSSSSRNSNSNSNSSHRRSQSSAGIGAETRDDGLETLNSTSLSSSRSAVPTEGLSPSPINKSDISGGGGGGESKAPGSSSPVAAAARKLASVVSSPSWLSHAQPVPPMPTLAPTAPAPPASFITSRTPGLTLAPMAAPPPKAPVPRYAKRKNKRDKPDGLAAVPFALASPSKKPADAEKSKKAQLQIPFFALIFVYMAVSSIAVGIVGWQFTISSAKSSVLDLSNKVQSLVAQEVVTAVGENANMITEMTTYQKDMFQKNKWSLTNGRGNTTVQSLLTFFKFFRQWAVNVLLITYPGGEVLGWHFPEDQSNATLTKIVQTGLTIAVYLCDYNGTPLRLMSNVTRLGDGTVANPGYNSTLSIMQNATYGYVNFSDPDYTRVSTIYAFSTVAHKTAIAVAKNPVTGETVVASSDWTMSLISDKFQAILKQFPHRMFVVAVESYSGRIISTSTKIPNVSPDLSTVLTYNNVPTEPFLVDFTNILAKEFPSTLTPGVKPETIATLQMIALTSALQDHTIVYSSSVNGRQQSVRVDLVPFVWDRGPWIIVQYLDVDDVLGNIHTTARNVEAIVLTVVAVAVLVGTSVALLLSRQIKLVTQQIAALKDMKFQEVLDRERGVKSRSFVLELYDLQVAFYEMTLKFAAHMRRAGRNGRNNTFSPDGASSTGSTTTRS